VNAIMRPNKDGNFQTTRMPWICPAKIFELIEDFRRHGIEVDVQSWCYGADGYDVSFISRPSKRNKRFRTDNPEALIRKAYRLWRQARG
jgi:hypothetical protein